MKISFLFLLFAVLFSVYAFADTNITETTEAPLTVESTLESTTEASTTVEPTTEAHTTVEPTTEAPTTTETTTTTVPTTTVLTLLYDVLGEPNATESLIRHECGRYDGDVVVCSNSTAVAFSIVCKVAFTEARANSFVNAFNNGYLSEIANVTYVPTHAPTAAPHMDDDGESNNKTGVIVGVIIAVVVLVVIGGALALFMNKRRAATSDLDEVPMNPAKTPATPGLEDALPAGQV